MKNWMASMLVFTVILCFAGCEREAASAPPTDSGFHAVGKKGTPPKGYSGAVLEKELLSKAVTVSDGYLLPENGVEKYDLKGDLLWRKDYPFITEDAQYASIGIFPAADDSFLICFDIANYQRQDGTWAVADPVLALCDRTGDLLWQKEYKGFGDATLGKAFFTDGGNIATIGCADGGETAPADGKDDIYLSLTDKNGELLAEKYYGGSDFEMFYDAAYIEGTGLVALISTQSGDGTFSASKDGKGEDVLLLIGDDLNIRWQKPLGTLFSCDSMRVTDEGIYLLDLQNNCLKVDFNGNTVYSGELRDKTVYSHLVGNSKYGLLIQCGNELSFYQDRTAGLKLKWDAGDVSRVIDTDKGFIVVSTNTTGRLPAPPYISAIWYSTELVYSGYDKTGKLLWRASFDNTPEALKGYDPSSDPVWGKTAEND